MVPVEQDPATRVCPDCGTPIAAQHSDRDYKAVWLGTFDEPKSYRPTVQWFGETRLPWLCIGQDLPDATAMLAIRAAAGRGSKT